MRYPTLPSVLDSCIKEIRTEIRTGTGTETGAGTRTSTTTDRLEADYQLYPLIFWYDSNHFCDVKRYLEIYYPFKYGSKVHLEIFFAFI